MMTEHFTLEELTRSQLATRSGLSNKPNPRQIACLTTLCESVLEPLRTALGKPIHINSGFRCRRLNAIVGGSERSPHMDGCAADIVVPGMSPRELATALAGLNLPVVDSIILEFDSWVHVAIAKNGKPRDRHLLALRDSATGCTEYIPTRFC